MNKDLTHMMWDSAVLLREVYEPIIPKDDTYPLDGLTLYWNAVFVICIYQRVHDCVVPDEFLYTIFPDSFCKKAIADLMETLTDNYVDLYLFGMAKWFALRAYAIDPTVIDRFPNIFSRSMEFANIFRKTQNTKIKKS